MNAKLSFTGGPELEAALKDLGSQVAGRLGENAVKAAARVVAARARQTTAFFDVTGTLRRSIRVLRDVDRVSGSRVAYAGTTVFYGRLIELGTSKMPARPFLRPALDESGQDAVNAMGANLSAGIDREIAKR
jgi:HK97 gp10 family phage protein